MRPVSFVIIFLFIITGCATFIDKDNSPYFEVPPQSTLLLNRGLMIPPNKARVYLQSGQIRSHEQIDQYNAHCWFLSWTLSPQTQLIAADTFSISRFRRLEEFVDTGVVIQLASAPGHFLGVGGNSVTAVQYISEFQIHSERQPDIRRLACNYWGDPNSDQHLSLQQIQQTLGEFATIQLTPPAQGK